MAFLYLMPALPYESATVLRTVLSADLSTLVMQRFSTLLRFLVLFALLIVGAANRPHKQQNPSSIPATVSLLLQSVPPIKG
ncbi:hypothetical protein [Hymenobacter pini]|uniref:hypothetical protein n=1 Tax=Hymenobacter pini TaxID=2880879 RepID=UPI001CF54BB1|nr:hypothetical protein [Hymenobacter pini]MCA8830925.1 hypothetical protein [Hymenobacter pini]